MTDIINADLRALGWRINDLTSRDYPEEYEAPELRWLDTDGNEGIVVSNGQTWIECVNTMDVVR